MEQQKVDISKGGELLSIAKVGQALGISRSTVYRLIDQGELERVHIGRRALVMPESVADYRQRLRP